MFYLDAWTFSYEHFNMMAFAVNMHALEKMINSQNGKKCLWAETQQAGPTGGKERKKEEGRGVPSPWASARPVVRWAGWCAGPRLRVGAVMRALGQRERSSQSGSMQKSYRSSPSLEQREAALGTCGGAGRRGKQQVGEVASRSWQCRAEQRPMEADPATACGWCGHGSRGRASSVS